MAAPLQWHTQITVAAPQERVWAIADDITLIPRYHPEVRHVELISGAERRAAGVRYRCTIPEGRKGNCIEEITEYVPGSRFVTAFPEDIGVMPDGSAGALLAEWGRRAGEDASAPRAEILSTCPSNLWAVARRKLTQINRVQELSELAVPPGNRLERLRGDRSGYCSIRINDQYRVCFRWKDGYADEVEITDYH